MSLPKVSVIIPAFNAEKTLRRAIDSALAQSYANYEIVVVNDGSRDSTASILASYADRIMVADQANGGAAAARNHGARLAKGEFLAFLDADDLWHPSKLELQTQVFREHPEIVLCSTHWKIYHDLDSVPSLEAQEIHDPPVEIVADFNRTFALPYLGTPSVMIPASVFERCGGFDESLSTSEDVDLWLRASYKMTIAMVKAPLVQVFRSSSGLTVSNADTIYANHLQVIENFCKRHPEYPQQHRQIVQITEAKILESWASSVLGRGNRKLARRLLARALSRKFSLRSAYLLCKSLLPAFTMDRPR
jgi:glycosyltransferase involved in cell wall biosynthesis